MNAAEFCALPEHRKRAHVAKLSEPDRIALVNAVADHHERLRAEADANTDPFRLRANAEFRAFAEKRARAP